MAYIVVASYGRSGSEMLYRSIHPYYADGGFVRDLQGADLKQGYCYKSHDYAPICLPQGARVIYIFGDPINAHISHHNNNKPKDVYRNAHRDVKRFRRRWKEDTLDLARNFSSWMYAHNFPILYLKYETMWRHVDELRAFIGCPVMLPTLKHRKTDWTRHPKRMALMETFIDLYRQYLYADECWVKEK